MIIPDPPSRVVWEFDGRRLTGTPLGPADSRTVRVNRRGRMPGPLRGAIGVAHRWNEDPRFRRSGHAGAAWFQEVRAEVFPHATIRVHGAIDLDVHDATWRELDLIDRTLALVPPDHLLRVQRRKPLGFHLTEFVGARSDPNFTGGLNPAHDAADTPYDDRQTIQLNRNAEMYAEGSRLVVWGTVLHEIGHNQRLSVTGPVLDAIAGIRVSTNDGPGEPLCDAYMHLICYGASSAAVRARGTRSTHPTLASPEMREALRECPAFRDLPAEWRDRYAERSPSGAGAAIGRHRTVAADAPAPVLN